jgi:hypothetical protein
MAAKPVSLRKAFLFIPILAALMLSGCTLLGTTTTSSGVGVVIKEFAPEFKEIYAGEPVTFRMLLKNEGSVDAINGFAELLGLDEDWCASQTASQTTGLQTCTNSDGGRPEMLPNDACSYKSSGAGFKLLAPDTQRGTEGGTQICTWTYKAPAIEKGFTIAYTPTARTFYTYKSGVVKLITFGSSSELRTIQDKGSALPTETVSTTSGPVQLGIETTGPIRFWPEENTVILPLEITIKNVGGGVACADEGITYKTKSPQENLCRAVKGETPKNKVRIKITFGAGTDSATASKMKLSTECTGFETGKTIALWKGQSNTIVCEVTASSLSSGATIQRMINVEAVYDYYTDTTSSITVIGRKVAS